MTPEITPADLERLQVDAGLPNPPTELTYSYRMAVSGEGELAPTWGDKPHRLVYDLCAHIERIAAEQRAQAEPVAWMYSDDFARDYLSDEQHPYRRHQIGWTETPLYAHPPQADGEQRALQAEADRLREALSNEIIPVLWKVVAYDQLLRKVSEIGDHEILLAGTMPTVDASYDDLIKSATDTLTRIDAILAGEGK